jgi:hypothetical protein
MILHEINNFCPDYFMSMANSAYLYSDGSQRYGQFLVNYFIDNYPGIILPQEADCFHDDKKVKQFLHFIYSMTPE